MPQTERIVCRPPGGGNHPKGVRRRAPAGKSLDRVRAEYPFRVNPETNPPQPDEISLAIAEALFADEPVPGPWWQAGIDESATGVFDLWRTAHGGAAPAQQARRRPGA